MKIFAIILLMLVSTMLLKAQTMVVETADSVESFEVGEIKSLSIFHRQYQMLRVICKKLPVATIMVNTDTHDTTRGSFVINDTQIVAFPRIIGNTVHLQNKNSTMHFIFFDITEPKWGSGSEQELNVIFDSLGTSTIKHLAFSTTGSTGGKYDQNKVYSWILGRFEIVLQNAEFNITEEGKIYRIIKYNEIMNCLQMLQHHETEWYYNTSIFIEMGIEKIIEENLSQDSEIIITIE